jgi:hypothetical protein
MIRVGSKPASNSAVVAPDQWWLALIAFFVIFLSATFSLYLQRPRQTGSSAALPTEFSSARAMKHIDAIATKPHPIGSTEHMAVRDYILKVLAETGKLDPNIQRTTIVSQQFGTPFRTATVENIVARLKGADSSRAILLVGHYDSMPTSFGASDDGSGTAQLLENARALVSGGTLKNDVIFLFSDGEEVGLLGAQAFLDEHAWSKDVGVVLNFEARGNGGPVLMFETSDQNGWLVSEFAKSSPHPITNSLMEEFYRRLPNNTDLSQFKSHGLPGLNFAFIDGVTHYHTQLDNIGSLDERSLQQEGAGALALTRHLGSLDLRNIKMPNAVFFDVLGWQVVHYSFSWVLPLAILNLLLFVAVAIMTIRSQQFRFIPVILGALFVALNAGIVWLIVELLWRVIRMTHAEYRVMPFGDTYNSKLYLVGFVTLTIAVTSFSIVLVRTKVSFPNLWMGAMLCWLVLMLVTSFALPAGSYLFFWPLLFSLLSVAAMQLLNQERFIARELVLLAGTLPGIILLSPMIKLLFTGLTVSAAAIPMVLVALLLGLLIPALNLMTTQRRWLIPGAMLLISIGFFVAGSATSAATAQRPRPDCIFYALNADDGRAFWASSDDLPDSWTTQFFARNPVQRPFSEFFPLTSVSFLVGEATPTALPAPEVSLVRDERDSDGRHLRLHIRSARQAPVISIYLEPGVIVDRASINEKQVPGNSGQAGAKGAWGLRYYALPAEGLDLNISLKTAGPFTMRVVDQTYGLPVIEHEPNPQRPDYIIPSPVPFTDTTQLAKSFRF